MSLMTYTKNVKRCSILKICCQHKSHLVRTKDIDKCHYHFCAKTRIYQLDLRYKKLKNELWLNFEHYRTSRMKFIRTATAMFYQSIGILLSHIKFSPSE